jgi:FlaA1/EpsC-like NDP-sugar epimerase
MLSKLKIFFLHRSRSQKRLIMIALDAVMLPVLLWIALSLGNNTFIVPVLEEIILYFLPVVIFFPILIKTGLYKSVLRGFQNKTIINILIATLVSTLGWAMITKLIGFSILTKSSVILYWLSTFTYMAGSRLLFQYWLYGDKKNRDQSKRVYIYGAGVAGTQLAGLLADDNSYSVEGFIDDDASLRGWNISGMNVKSFDKTAPILIEEDANTEVIIAMPSVERSKRQFIIDRLEPFPVKVRTIPAVADFTSGDLRVSDIKDIDIDDLLGRIPVKPDSNLLPANISDKVVLLTGAGGSIGSELCRQVLQLKPKKMILLELSEFALYQIEQELTEIMSNLEEEIEIERILGSCGDQALLDRLFTRNNVQTVYHAAAYKHVPLVEENPIAGLTNNIFGTRTLARTSLSSNVETFILISTDKAVRPTNIMGCSKRIAEMVLQSLADSPNCKTTFSMVRFGNVLGSSGSVVPKFRQQIADGGPITVTHKDITRYFMSIPEAVQLVIQAGAMGQGGDVFVLDMGESVKICDLATKMIRLSGLNLKDESNPDGDIELRYSGLRPGEKLYEELLIGDNVKRTEHSRIMQANEEFLSIKELNSLLEKLNTALLSDNVEPIKKSLKTVVSGYTPWIFKDNDKNIDKDNISKETSNIVPINRS